MPRRTSRHTRSGRHYGSSCVNVLGGPAREFHRSACRHDIRSHLDPGCGGRRIHRAGAVPPPAYLTAQPAACVGNHLLVNLVLLTVSGLLREGNGFLATMHAVTGHLMLPLVAVATGLWLGASFSKIRRRPFRAFPPVLFLLLLCFLCLSNTWTGYFGPARIDPEINPATNLRFEVIHRWAVPILIGTMLLFWLRHLLAGPSGTRDTPTTLKSIRRQAGWED